MLDLKFVRENPKLVEEAVKSRNGSLDLTEFLELDKQRREITQQVEALKKERNTASQEIGKLKKQGCHAVVYSLHGGKEYSPKHNRIQEKMAKAAVDAGASLVVGTHPHCVQGIQRYKGAPILYSL